MNASPMVPIIPPTGHQPLLETAPYAANSPVSPRNHRLQPSGAKQTPMAISAIAYAGMDMPVHMVLSCRTNTGMQFRQWTLDYAAFNRLVRQRIARSAAIALLTAIGALQTTDPKTGLRCWGHLQVAQILHDTPVLVAAQAGITSRVAA